MAPRKKRTPEEALADFQKRYEILKKDGKVCGRCKNRKPIDEFYMKSNFIFMSECKVCNTVNGRKKIWKKKGKQAFLNYLVDSKAELSGLFRIGVELGYIDEEEKDLSYRIGCIANKFIEDKGDMISDENNVYTHMIEYSDVIDLIELIVKETKLMRSNYNY